MEHLPALYKYETGEFIRDATALELEASEQAARSDGGRGVIVCTVEGKEIACYALG